MLSMDHAMDTKIEPAWWHRPYVLPALSVAGAVLAVGIITLAFWGTRERSLRTPLNNVTISTVEKNIFHDFVPLHGTVAPKDAIEMDALEGGQVEKILVQAGDTVVQGLSLIHI